MADVGTGKLLYDTTMASFSEQRQTQIMLVARSKELLSAGSIAGTITTIAGNNAILSAEKPPGWWLVLVVGAILVEIIAALAALHPKPIAVSVNPPDLKAKMMAPAHSELTLDQWYQSIAYSVIGNNTVSHYDLNARRNKRLAILVMVQVWALATIVILAALLLFVL